MSATQDERALIDDVIDDQEADEIGRWSRIFGSLQDDAIVQWEDDQHTIAVFVTKEEIDDEIKYSARAEALGDDVAFGNKIIERWEESLETALDEALQWMRRHVPGVAIPTFSMRIENGILKPLMDVIRRLGGQKTLIEVRENEIHFESASHVNQVDFEISRADMEQYDVDREGEFSIDSDFLWDAVQPHNFGDTIPVSLDGAEEQPRLGVAGVSEFVKVSTDYFRRDIPEPFPFDAQFTVPGLEYRDVIRAAIADDASAAVFGVFRGVPIVHIEPISDVLEFTGRFDATQVEGEQLVLVTPDRLQEIRQAMVRPSQTDVRFTIKADDPMLAEYSVDGTDVDVLIALRTGPVPRDIDIPVSEIEVPEEADEEEVAEVAARQAIAETEDAPDEPEPEPERQPVGLPNIGAFESVENTDEIVRWAADDGTGAVAENRNGVWVVWVVDDIGNRRRVGDRPTKSAAIALASDTLRDFDQVRDARNFARSPNDFAIGRFRRITGNDITGQPLNALAEHFYTIDDLRDASVAEIETIDGVGPQTVEDLQRNFDLREDPAEAPSAPPPEEAPEPDEEPDGVDTQFEDLEAALEKSAPGTEVEIFKSGGEFTLRITPIENGVQYVDDAILEDQDEDLDFLVDKLLEIWEVNVDRRTIPWDEMEARRREARGEHDTDVSIPQFPQSGVEYTTGFTINAPVEGRGDKEWSTTVRSFIPADAIQEAIDIIEDRLGEDTVAALFDATPRGSGNIIADVTFVRDALDGVDIREDRVAELVGEREPPEEEPEAEQPPDEMGWPEAVAYLRGNYDDTFSARNELGADLARFAEDQGFEPTPSLGDEGVLQPLIRYQDVPPEDAWTQIHSRAGDDAELVRDVIVAFGEADAARERDEEDAEAEDVPPPPEEEPPEVDTASIIVSIIGGTLNYNVPGQIPGPVVDEAIGAARDVLGAPGQFDANDTVGEVTFRGDDVESVSLEAGRDLLGDEPDEEPPEEPHDVEPDGRDLIELPVTVDRAFQNGGIYVVPQRTVPLQVAEQIDDAMTDELGDAGQFQTGREVGSAFVTPEENAMAREFVRIEVAPDVLQIEPEEEPEPQVRPADDVDDELSRGQMETIIEEATVGVTVDLEMMAEDFREARLDVVDDPPIRFRQDPERITFSAGDTQRDTIRNALERWEEFAVLSGLSPEEIAEINQAREVLSEQFDVELPFLPQPTPEGVDDDDIQRIIGLGTAGVSVQVDVNPDADSVRIRMEPAEGSDVAFAATLDEVQGQFTNPIFAIREALDEWDEAADLATVDVDVVNRRRARLAREFDIDLPEVERVAEVEERVVEPATQEEEPEILRGRSELLDEWQTIMQDLERVEIDERRLAGQADAPVPVEIDEEFAATLDENERRQIEQGLEVHHTQKIHDDVHAFVARLLDAEPENFYDSSEPSEVEGYDLVYTFTLSRNQAPGPWTNPRFAPSTLLNILAPLDSGELLVRSRGAPLA